MKSKKIITHVELTVTPELIDEILPQAERTRDIIILEDGCEIFMLTTKKEASNVLVIFAIYTSEKAYKWHLKQDYVTSFFALLEGKLLGEPKLEFLEEFHSHSGHL